MIALSSLTLLLLLLVLSWEVVRLYHRRLFDFKPGLSGYNISQAKMVIDTIESRKSAFTAANNAFGIANSDAAQFRTESWFALRRQKNRAWRKYMQALWLARKLDRQDLLHVAQKIRLAA